MLYNAPYGAPNPADPFVNGDPSIGRKGSIIPAAAVEYTQREIVAAITNAGLTPSNGDLGQLFKACQYLIQKAQPTFASDAGLVNALSITPTPLAQALVDGQPFRIRVANTTTSTTPTLVVALLAGGTTVAKTVVRHDGSALAAGELRAGQIISVVWNATLDKFQLIGLSGISSPSRTIYVRTDGNDNNDGSANTAGSALRTIAKAISIVQTSYFLAGTAVTIQLGNAGTYDPVWINGPVGNLTIQGDVAAQDSYIIPQGNPAGGACFNAFNGAIVTTNGIATKSTQAGANIMQAYAGAVITCKKHSFWANGITAGSYAFAQPGGQIWLQDTIRMEGAAQIAFQAGGGDSYVAFQGTTFALTGTPAFTTFAKAYERGVIEATSPAFSGSATGSRYAVALGGLINTNGGGSSLFPGNSVGTTDGLAGSYYAA